jgi:hypothetical protein
MPMPAPGQAPDAGQAALPGFPPIPGP